MWKINKNKSAIKFFMYSKDCEECLGEFEKLNFKDEKEYQDFIKNKIVVMLPDSNLLENDKRVLMGFHIEIRDRGILSK